MTVRDDVPWFPGHALRRTAKALRCVFPQVAFAVVAANDGFVRGFAQKCLLAALCLALRGEPLVEFCRRAGATGRCTPGGTWSEATNSRLTTR